MRVCVIYFQSWLIGLYFTLVASSSFPDSNETAFLIYFSKKKRRHHQFLLSHSQNSFYLSICHSKPNRSLDEIPGIFVTRQIHSDNTLKLYMYIRKPDLPSVYVDLQFLSKRQIWIPVIKFFQIIDVWSRNWFMIFLVFQLSLDFWTRNFSFTVKP